MMTISFSIPATYIVPEPAYLIDGIVHGDQSTSEIDGELGGALYIMFENHVRS